MKSTRFWCGVGLVVLGAVWLGCGRGERYEKPLTPVRVQPVESYAGERGVRYSANIRPYAQVDMAFRVGGYVREIPEVAGADGRRRTVQEGDPVARGSVLARLRDADYVAKVNQAKSQLAEALAAVEQARSQLAEARAATDQAASQLAEAQASSAHAAADFDRAKNLVATQSITRSDYDGARARFEMARAKVDEAGAQLAGSRARADAARAQVEAVQARVGAARAQLQEAEIALQDTALVAPMDGVVLKRTVEVGTLVAPGAVGFVLADLASVKAVFGVADVVVHTMKSGSSLAVTTEALPAVEFRGRVTRISPSADPESRVFEVEITIPNPGNRLRAGMIAALNVARERLTKPIAMLPVAAIVRPKGEPAGYAVFVVERRGEAQVARVRRVTLGEAVGNLIAVGEGVKAGEEVIVSGASLVTDGEKVRVVP